MPIDARRLWKRHIAGSPSLERAGFQRFRNRRGIRALREIDRLSDDDDVAEPVERGVNGRLVEFLLIPLRQPVALRGKFLLRRID